MNSNSSKHLPKNGGGSSLLKKLKKNGKEVAFVLVYVLVGSYLLISSQAATGNDLVVTNVSMTPTAPSAGEHVTFSATIKNQGTTDVPSGTVVGVGFYIDGNLVTWNKSNTAGLAAGQSVTLTANSGVSGSAWQATNGPHTLTATADYQNVIPDETNEANNSRSITFTIGNTGSIYSNPRSSTVNEGENVSLAIRINPGTNVDGVETTLTYDAAKLQFVSLDTSNSPFDLELQESITAGSIKLSRGNLSGGVSTDALIANVTFKSLVGEGNTTIVQIDGNAAANGVYTNPQTPDADVTFKTPDEIAPSVSFSNVTNGDTVFGDKTISVNASDNIGVTKVEFYIDGMLRNTDTTSPFSYTQDTTVLTNGTHSLQAKAYDAAGNVGSTSQISVTVKNWPEDINQDGVVNLLDFSLLATKYGQTGTDLGREDINQDGAVNLLDFSLLAGKFGQ